MDVMRTPPHSSSPVGFFGEETFLWAPKKSRQYRKPPLRNGRKSSSRSLDFSSILVQDEDDENSSFSGSYERRQSHIFGNGTRNETPVYMRNVDTPARPTGSPLAFENTIARRIDFASQSHTPRQEGMVETKESPLVFSPGLSPGARGILSQLKRSAGKRGSAEKHSCALKSSQETPQSCSPHKKGRWTRLIR